MSNDPIKVAIGGFGRSGYNIHGRCLPELPQKYKVVAVADELPERRADAENNLGATTYSDYRDMLAAGGFDLFVNATPSFLHVDGNIEALERGYHVVSEKPMANNVKDFDRMVAAAKQAERKLFPFQNNRLQPYFYKMREVIDSGVLGKIINIRSTWGGFRRRWDWQTLQKNMGGALFNTGPHAVDQAVMLFGEDRQPEVFCRMNSNNTFGGDADDFCSVTLFDPEREAPQIDILITAYQMYPLGDMYHVCGTHGGLTGNSERLQWRWFEPDEAPDHDFWKPWSIDRKYPSEELTFHEDSWELSDDEKKQAVGYTLKSYPSGPHRVYANIYEVLRAGAEQIITTDQVRRQIQIFEDCHKQNPLPRKA